MSEIELLGGLLGLVVFFVVFRFLILPIIRGNREVIIFSPDGSNMRFERIKERKGIAKFNSGSVLLKNVRYWNRERWNGYRINKFLLVRENDARPLMITGEKAKKIPKDDGVNHTPIHLDESAWLSPIPMSADEFDAAIAEHKVVDSLRDKSFDWRLLVMLMLGFIALLGVVT